MIDMLDKPEDLSVGLYINMATSIDCSGNLTGYYYTYLYQDDPVLKRVQSVCGQDLQTWTSTSAYLCVQ